MKTIIQFVLAGVLTIMPMVSFAHSNHAPVEPVTAEQVGNIAGGVVQNLVRNKKLADSWKAVKPTPATRRDTRYGPVWVVTFSNAEEVDKSKQSLSVFVDEFGSPLTANHEGKLQ
jgi:hypothetical protein